MRAAGASLILAVLARAQDPLLWGKLEPGPYPVGFQSFIVRDGTRAYGGTGARPILLQVWYPASNVKNAGLVYAGYLRVPDAGAHPWFRERLERFARDVVSDGLFHKKTESALNSQERAAFEKLLATRTTAHLDALPARGSFPLVLYHAGAGGSFEENSLLLEYLAGHGYMVVSSAFQSPDPESVGNNTGGIERSGPDLDFIAQHARRQWPYADAARLAIIGHSAGAQIMIEWIGSPKCPARAFVSLDTTLEYTMGTDLHKPLRDTMRKLTPPRIPILLFAQARLRPRFDGFDRYLRHSPHYEAEAAGLHHDDFLTHGYLGRALMGLEGADAIRRGYEDVCRTIRSFLDASLKGDEEGKRWLKRPSSSAVTIRYKPPR